MSHRSVLAERLQRQVLIWRAAVHAQHERIPVGFKESRTERWADPQLYAYALRNLLRACWAANKHFPESDMLTTALTEFEAEVPHARKIRDTLDKFHNEELTEPGGLTVWVTWSEGYTEFALHVVGRDQEELVLDLDVATAAAERMVARCLSGLATIGQVADDDGS